MKDLTDEKKTLFKPKAFFLEGFLFYIQLMVQFKKEEFSHVNYRNKISANRKPGETTTGTVNPPVYFSTAYRHEGIGKSTGFDYSRTGNPTRGLLEQAIADLECGEQGYACSSGMAAVLLVLSLFRSGDELIVSEDLYGGTYRLFSEHEKVERSM